MLYDLHYDIVHLRCDISATAYSMYSIPYIQYAHYDPSTHVMI